MKILICEDDYMTLKAVEHHLKRNGFDTEIAQNGREAVEKLEVESFNIVLVDIHMPYMNGLELINHIRNTMKSRVPIVVLTRIGLEDTAHEAFSLGADDYITKPFNPEELTLRLKRLLIENENI
jgi:DNA-binding response OmpR family regulator